MKAITPPKLMPPFQSTAASGTFPIEQTKEMTATNGPTSGPQNLANVSWPEKKNDSQKRVRHPGGECARDQEALATAVNPLGDRGRSRSCRP
jgi:hypothetical protein